MIGQGHSGIFYPNKSEHVPMKEGCDVFVLRKACQTDVI